eukprot:CAMPEP_0113278002 /NCGR_PEP_ID=MMETSP0008_2-20120614/26360_1 /TAXON_ID=97485 /ORGANISM="Prymnesium parvum" /LENGTH=68 /DNA_ID=CAMNT_0000127973 /DNA_START=413 /DNA_END=616 /DNA_ORIENTATION=- /assembly_acc=CAM_ASM_000153
MLALHAVPALETLLKFHLALKLVAPGLLHLQGYSTPCASLVGSGVFVPQGQPPPQRALLLARQAALKW